MKLIEAENLITDLKSTLTDEYWGDIYCLMQNALLPEADREYDVYVEILTSDFDINRIAELINFIGTSYMITFAFYTKQIIFS